MPSAPLVGVGPVAPAALGAPPGRESAAALGTFPHPWGWVPLARQSDWGFFSWVHHSTERFWSHVSFSHQALSASDAVRRGLEVSMLSLLS